MTTTSALNEQIVLASRPSGMPAPENFRHISAELQAVPDGHVRVRHHFLSLDPYMRGRMNDGKSYAQPQPLDAVMIGGTAGEVVASRHPGFAVGDKVVGMGGWQLYSMPDARLPGMLRKVDTARVPLSAYLGAVGMPGVTAWVGLTHVIGAERGETVLVSAASGAVGSVVGQLAKARGCRVVGIAGGDAKCNWLTGELGFDAAVDHKAHAADPRGLLAAVQAAAPDGIDGCFENVGGAVLDAALACMNPFGRIALCGMISGYNGHPIPLAQPSLVLTQRLRMQGFIVSEHMDLWPPALAELGALVADGRLKYRETVEAGLANAPQAFIGLLEGRNFGKQLVDLQ